MRTIKDIEFLKDVKVILRTDFNVPTRNGVITDDYRIKISLETIDFLRSRGAKIILLSHIESSIGGDDSLKVVADRLNHFGERVTFISNIRNAHDFIETKLKAGEIVLIENTRSFKGEIENDTKFAKELASLGDIYVNEAFSVSHRKHASIVGIPKFLPSYFGLQFEREVNNLSQAFNPAHPFLFILGGAKFSTKIPLINKFLDIADNVFVGGALANNLFKEKGVEVGQSVVDDSVNAPHSMLDNSKLILPIDVLVKDKTSRPLDMLTKTDVILDAGPLTLKVLGEKIEKAGFILWNGPLGMYEDGYKEPTHELARMVASATKRGAITIIGGGDTLAAINETGMNKDFTFISGGGGASLDFLAKGTLPGIDAIQK